MIERCRSTRPTGAGRGATTTPRRVRTRGRVDVLLNDVDPERDALRIASFTPPDIGGGRHRDHRSVRAAGAALPAPLGLRAGDVHVPSRRLVRGDGEPARSHVDIAQPQDDNRPPIVQPDAVRLRRNTPTSVAVLANDRDPDGDRWGSRWRPRSAGGRGRGRRRRDACRRPGWRARLVPFPYLVDDLHGNVVPGTVLVVIDRRHRAEPAADRHRRHRTAVVGTVQAIDVLSNDNDPDGDPIVVGVRPTRRRFRPGTCRTTGQFTRADRRRRRTRIVRFSYTVSDGNGHEVAGEVSVRVLPEPVAVRRMPATTRSRPGRRAGDDRRAAQRRRPFRRAPEAGRHAGLPGRRARHGHERSARHVHTTSREVRGVPLHVRGDQPAAAGHRVDHHQCDRADGPERPAARGEREGDQRRHSAR